MKEKIYQSCLRSAMLYESDTWCLREIEMEILRRTEKAIIRAMCGVKLIEKRRIQELMSLLSLKDTLNGLAKASEVRWDGHVLTKEKGDVLKRALNF